MYTIHEGSEDGLKRNHNDITKLLEDDSDHEEDDGSFNIDMTVVDIGNELSSDYEDEQEDSFPEEPTMMMKLYPPVSTRTTRVVSSITPAISPERYESIELSAATSTPFSGRAGVGASPTAARGVSQIGPSYASTRFVRNRTADSFQGSLESIGKREYDVRRSTQQRLGIQLLTHALTQLLLHSPPDSLAESYWDPEDDASQATPIMTNLFRSSAFFHEHVHFLRDQTQPRKVEVVWNGPAPKEEPSDGDILTL